MKKLILTLGVIGALSACSDETKKDLGLINTAPDEFSVVTRAPLSVPPDYTLRPPRPGTQRPMEISTKDQARQTIFGVQDMSQSGVTTTGTAAQNSFLDKVGVKDSDADIRNVLASEEPVDSRTTAERLLFLKSKDENLGEPIDPNEEFERLKQEGVVTVKKRNEETPAP